MYLFPKSLSNHCWMNFKHKAACITIYAIFYSNRRRKSLQREYLEALFQHYWKTQHTCDISLDLSADLEFVLVEEKFLQVVLHLYQSQVEVAVGEQIVAALSSWFGCNRTVHCHGEGAHSSLQAGDISLDLAEKLCERVLQCIIQKSKVMADTSQSVNGRNDDFYLGSHRQLRKGSGRCKMYASICLVLLRGRFNLNERNHPQS